MVKINKKEIKLLTNKGFKGIINTYEKGKRCIHIHPIAEVMGKMPINIYICRLSGYYMYALFSWYKILGGVCYRKQRKRFVYK